FDILRQHIPYERRNKKLSKADTLKSAMNYINDLQKLLGTDAMLIQMHHVFDTDKIEEDTLPDCRCLSTNSFCTNYNMNKYLRQQFENGKENRKERIYTMSDHQQEQQSLHMMTLINTTKHEMWDWSDSSISQ
ncbi:unnamed protein product, partial [Didymodactylos carnosus]